MAKVLSSISISSPTSPLTPTTGDSFTFEATNTFSGGGGVQRYDEKWEVDDGGGYVTIASSGTGLTTASTNPQTNLNSQSANSITVDCTDAGSYTIRISGASSTGGAYDVTSGTQTVDVSDPPAATTKNLGTLGVG